VLLVLDDARREAIAEHVAVTAVAVVVGARVALVEAFHAGGEIRLRPVEDEVVVRAHEAKGVHLPGEPFDDVEQDEEEGAVVLGVAEEQRVGDGPCGGVVEAVGQFAAEWAGHASTVREGRALGDAWGRIVAELSQFGRGRRSHVRGLTLDMTPQSRR
jgi:hypothetical protein